MNRTIHTFLLISFQVITLWAESKSRPNIIYLMADDQNTLSVGCYGNPEVKTPQMDLLGTDGVVFDKHYNTTAICKASRASILTGMYEYKTGTNFSHGKMKQSTWKKSYPVLLREAGYMVGFAGKFGIEVEGQEAHEGMCPEDFDVWGGGSHQTEYETKKNQSMKDYAQKYPHSTLSYGAFGQDFIKKAVQQNKPFCLSISFKAPHMPPTPDPRFDHVYKGKTFTKPDNFGREYAKHMSEQSKQGRQYERFHIWKYDTDYDEVMQKYYQLIYGIDVAIGMIREELKKQGIDKNTVIIYTSDNGYICGAHGYASKVLPMEEAARAPMMIYDPRSKVAGKKLRCGALTGNIDFAPTILALAGLPIPEHMDGKSLLPLLDDPKKDIRTQMAFMNVYDKIPTRSLTCLTKDWKYTYWWYQDDHMKACEELFDLKNDPLELKNCAVDQHYQKQLLSMREAYDREVNLWQKGVVKYNDYETYGTFFDRNVPWQTKYDIIKKWGTKKKNNPQNKH